MISLIFWLIGGRKVKSKIIIVILFILILSGCSNNETEILPLNYSEINLQSITNQISQDEIYKIIQEESVNNDTKAFLFQTGEDSDIFGGLKIGDIYYDLGAVSIMNTPVELLGVEEQEIFGETAIKFHGLLGANYSYSLYWFVNKGITNSVLQVDGHTAEIDINNDKQNELVSTIGTIPETRIYKFENDKVLVADINNSIEAKTVTFNQDKNIFEVYFEPNKPKYYSIYDNSLKRIE